LARTGELFNMPLVDFLTIMAISPLTELFIGEVFCHAFADVPSITLDALTAFAQDFSFSTTSVPGHYLANLTYSTVLSAGYHAPSLDTISITAAFLQNALSSTVADVVPAFLYQSTLCSTPTWFGVLLSLDPVVVAFEVFLIGAFFLAADKFVFSTTGRQVFYDDLVTLFKYNNISLTEVGVTLTLSVGFIFFDIFVSFAEEDVVDALNYLILIFVVLTFIFLLLATDVQYFYMVSNAGGDLTLRIVVFDLVNNILCALRVFFC